jgi:hypothetical protein
VSQILIDDALPQKALSSVKEYAQTPFLWVSNMKINGLFPKLWCCKFWDDKCFEIEL